MERVLEVVSYSFDGPDEVLGTIKLDANGDMVFDDPRHMDLISRFFYSGKPTTAGPDKTDREVFDLLYDGGGWSNGRVGVGPQRT